MKAKEKVSVQPKLRLAWIYLLATVIVLLVYHIFADMLLIAFLFVSSYCTGCFFRVSGLIMLFTLVCPGFIEQLSALLGIQTPSNTVFALTMFFNLIILMSVTSIVSKLNERQKKIIQYTALLEKRIR